MKLSFQQQLPHLYRGSPKQLPLRSFVAALVLFSIFGAVSETLNHIEN
jgi:hypothetical protein